VELHALAEIKSELIFARALRAAARLLGIVTHGGSLGVTIDDKNDRIDIQSETVAAAR
jgi:hypothetical protein